MHPEANRLFALDEALRAEAAQMLSDSGLGAILADCGYAPVGSQVTRTMVWRDLDFERYREPDWDEHWQVGTLLARTGWCTRLQCTNVYREQFGRDFGLYWGVMVAPPDRTTPAPKGDPTVWKLDIWTARECEFDHDPRRRWESLMTEEARAAILGIKEAVCRSPEYRKTLLSVHIYEAVLEHGVRGIEEFEEWRRQAAPDR